MNDIDINNEFGKFKLRVSAILIKNGKILVHEGKKFKGFCFPGGHVELGETTSEAIKREMREELNVEVNIVDIFCINENIYTNNVNVVSQEINYYYKVELLFDVLPDEPFEIIEIDKGTEKKHKFHWIPITELVESNLQPIDISKLITENPNISKNINISDYRNKNEN